MTMIKNPIGAFVGIVLTSSLCFGHSLEVDISGPGEAVDIEGKKLNAKEIFVGGTFGEESKPTREDVPCLWITNFLDEMPSMATFGHQAKGLHQDDNKVEGMISYKFSASGIRGASFHLATKTVDLVETFSEGKPVEPAGLVVEIVFIIINRYKHRNLIDKTLLSRPKHKLN